MELNDIVKLMEQFDASRITFLEYKAGDVVLKLEKQENGIEKITEPMQYITREPVLNQAIKTIENDAEYIKSPMVGIFYLAAEPGAEPFVEVGKQVEKGDTVCMIEAMKMMSEVEAPKSGTIMEVLVKNGDMVEFDMPLFRIQE